MNHQGHQAHDGGNGHLERIAFALLLVLVIARALALETLRDPFEISPGADAVPRTLTAAASVWMDWLACVPALLVLIGRSFDRRPLARSCSAIVLIALATFAGLSASWSSDKFAAVISVSHFIAGVTMFWAAMQLVRDYARLRMVAGVCFGLLLALVAYGLIYRFVELPDLRESIQKNWATILAQRGWEPGSFMETQFRKKVLAGEMVGFNSSPNTFAALLVLLMVVAIGAIIERLRDPESRGWGAMIAIAIPPAIVVLWFTQSRTAFATPVIAIACLVALAIAGKTIARHRKLVFIGTIALIALGTIALVAFGVSRGNLLHDSLTFRWRYWIGSARVFHSHPIHGVGWNNFGDAYLPFREAIASEEIKDPHNFFVRFATELGAIGLLLSIGWLISLWWEMTSPPPREDRHGQTGSALPRLAWIAIVGIALNIFMSVDLTQGAAWILLEALKRMLYLALILIGLILVTFRSFARQEIDDRPSPWIRRGILVALGVFLIHNAIDFSFFETGPMWLFMTLAGAMVGIVNERNANAHTTRPLAIVSTLAWIAALAILVPLTLAEAQAHSADEALRAKQPSSAARDYLDAFATLPFSNSDYLYRATRAMAFAAEPIDPIRDTIQRAIATNPRAPGNWSFLARLEAQQPTPDMPHVIAAYERFLALDPNDVQSRLQYAQSLDAAGMKQDAIVQYEMALAKNSQLHPDEPKRLSSEKIDEINAAIARLR